MIQLRLKRLPKTPLGVSLLWKPPKMSEYLTMFCPDELMFLRPHAIDELCRVGRHSDGGYVVCEEAILKANCFISLGLGEDWSYEIAISEMNPSADINIYDHTVSLSFFASKVLRGFIKFILRRDTKSNLMARIKRLCDYSEFWRRSPKHHHHQIHISKYSFEKIMSEIPDEEAVGLKIDIEGSEWEILETISNHQSRFVFVLIEIHDFDGHENQLEEFLSDLSKSFVLAHVHANNFAPLGKNGFPSVFEISLIRSTCIIPTGKLRSQLPLTWLDAPNAKNRPDFVINFA
jgi:hypothetical protein